MYNQASIYKGGGVYNLGDGAVSGAILLNGKSYNNSFKNSADGNFVESSFKNALFLPDGYDKKLFVVPSETGSVTRPMLITTEYSLPIDFGSIYCSFLTLEVGAAYSSIFASTYYNETTNITRIIAGGNDGIATNIFLMNINSKASVPSQASSLKGVELKSDKTYKRLPDGTYTSTGNIEGSQPAERFLNLLSPGSKTRIYYLFVVDKSKNVTFTAIPCKHGDDYGFYDLVAGKFYTNAILTGG